MQLGGIGLCSVQLLSVCLLLHGLGLHSTWFDASHTTVSKLHLIGMKACKAFSVQQLALPVFVAVRV